MSGAADGGIERVALVAGHHDSHWKYHAGQAKYFEGHSIPAYLGRFPALTVANVHESASKPSCSIRNVPVPDIAWPVGVGRGSDLAQ